MRRFASCMLLLAMLCTGAAAAGDPPALSPTTGLPTDRPYRPVLVQISNNKQARPVIGLAEADIVYEAVYWGPRHTRYLALYNDSHPAQVGSLRSTRVYFFELMKMWDCPYVFWGRQRSTVKELGSDQFIQEHSIPENMLFDGTRSSFAALARVPDRHAPHNAVVDIGMIAEAYWPADEAGVPFTPRLPGLSFSGDPSTSDAPVSAIDVVYEKSEYAARYVYDADAGIFERWYDGAPQADASGSAIRVANVIVLHMDLSFYGNQRAEPILRTTGSGPMDVFIRGRHIRGVWYRERMDDFVRYIGDDGADIVFAPGKTFIQIVPMEMEIQITSGRAPADDGTDEPPFP